MTKLLPGIDLEVKKFKKNEPVFLEGNSGTEVYIVKSGEARVLKQVGNSEVELALLKADDIFGEMALIGNYTRSATVSAKNDLEVYVLEQEKFLMMYERLPAFFKKVFSILGSRLRTMDQRIRSHLKTGIELSVFNTLMMIGGNSYEGNTESVSIPLNSTKLRIQAVLGLGNKETDEAFANLSSIPTVSINSKKDSITIKDFKQMQLFPDYAAIKQNKNIPDEFRKCVAGLSESTEKIFKKIYRDLSQKQKELYIFE